MIPAADSWVGDAYTMHSCLNLLRICARTCLFLASGTHMQHARYCPQTHWMRCTHCMWVLILPILCGLKIDRPLSSVVEVGLAAFCVTEACICLPVLPLLPISEGRRWQGLGLSAQHKGYCHIFLSWYFSDHFR